MNSQNMSIVSLVLQASWVVQLVMLLLVVISIASWATIFKKFQALRRAGQDTEDFEKAFWSGGDLMQLYDQAQKGDHGDGLSRVFESGMREFLKLRQQGRTEGRNNSVHMFHGNSPMVVQSGGRLATSAQ